VKSFAREVITPTLLGIFATTTSSATKLHFATFHISDTGSLCFCLTLQILLLLFLEKAQAEFLPSLCRGVCNQLSGCPLHFVSQGRSPFDFTHSKSYFRHFNNGLLSFNSSAYTIQLLVLQMTATALTLSLNTNSLKSAPQGGLIKLPE
jgi:hypothetical protein